MIYFITAREIGRVKIGFSEVPSGRLVKMQSDSPVPLKMERVIDGERSDEAALHSRFADHRLRGEWFTLHAEIEAHMAALPAPIKKCRTMSMGQKIVAATGCSPGYASQMLSDKYPHNITVPIAVAVYRAFGDRIGPIVDATDQEIDTLEKYCGEYKPRSAAA